MTSAAITHPDIHISGDVRIDPRAVIAHGVILQANANSYIAIAAGVCIGVGCIVQAHQGNIEIQSGAIIGAGSLIIGTANIGENVCIGYGTTIFRASIIAATILPPNSLVGDISRQNKTNSTNTTQTFKPSSTGKQTTETFDPWQDISHQSEAQPLTPTTPVTPDEQPPPLEQTEDLDIPQELAELEEPEIIPTIPEVIEELQAELQTINKKAPVVGQVYINQLLMTLFPHQNPIKPPNKFKAD